MNLENISKKDFYVCVECTTFNHAGFVKDALDGFVSQETSFPYICVIIDDASTDGTQDRINEYVSKNFRICGTEESDDYILTLACHTGNAQCSFAIYMLKYNHYSIRKDKECYINEWKRSSKYLAFCEGDDCWVLPEKLQTQVTFLDNHSEITLSCHRYNIYDVDSKQLLLEPNHFFDSKRHKSSLTYEFDLEYNYTKYWTTKYLSLVVRKDAVNPNWRKDLFYSRDVHFVYYILKKGHGVCHSFIGGVYRRNNPSSIWGNRELGEKLRINCDVFREFADKVNDPLIVEIARNRMIAYYLYSLKGMKGGYYVSLKTIRAFHYMIRLFKNVVSKYPKDVK